jgi:hypothetical protein
MAGDLTHRESHELFIDLCTGFRDHTIVIVVDAREVYRRSAVTTDPATSRADAIKVVASAPTAQIEVSVTPGDLFGSIACDTAAHRHLAISLVGEATLNLETFA